jgi:hypothetical protein
MFPRSTNPLSHKTEFFFCGTMVLDPQSDCGIINKPKKKNVLGTNEQEQNPTALSRWLEGVFF